jgi:hypothetical protein
MYKKEKDNQMYFMSGEDRKYVDSDRLILQSLLATLCELKEPV